MKLSKGIFFKFLALLAIANLLTACTAGQSASASSKEPLRVEYTLWWGDYTILVAQELGLFEKYGVAVEPVFYESYADSYSDLAARTIDGGLLSLDNAINTNDKSPLKAVAMYDNGGIFYLVGDTSTKNMSDLRGKVIGLEIGTSAELILLEALQQNGLSLNDVTLVDVAVEAISENLGNTIDAGIVREPYASKIRAGRGNTLFELGGTKTIVPGLIVFNSDSVKGRPDDIHAFLQAWFEAVDFRIADPQQANQIIATKTGLSADEITAVSQVYTLQENIVLLSDQTPDNMINLTTAFNINTDFLLGLGVLRKQPDMNQFIDSSFLFE